MGAQFKLRGNGLRPAQSYSPKEIAKALEVAETTVRDWIRDGKLPAMTNGNPHLVLGCDVTEFLKKKRQKRPPMAEDQFRCMRCKAPRLAFGGMADFTATSVHVGHLSALCDQCGTPMSKGAAIKDLPRLRAVFDLRITPASGHYAIPDDAS